MLFSCVYELKLILTFWKTTWYETQNSLEDIDPDAHHYDATTMKGDSNYQTLNEYHASRNPIVKSLTFLFYNILSYKTSWEF